MSTPLDIFLSNQSMVSSFDSIIKFIPCNTIGYSIQLNYTGAPVGTLKIQCSNDGSVWSDIPGASVAISGAGTTMFNVEKAYYREIKLVYVATSGNGDMSAYYFGKKA